MIRMLKNIPLARGSWDEVTAVPHMAQPCAAASGAAPTRTAMAAAARGTSFIARRPGRALRTDHPRVALESSLRKVHQSEEGGPDGADEPPVRGGDAQRRRRSAQPPRRGNGDEDREPDDRAEHVQR